MADGAVAQALVLEAPRRLVVRELPLPHLGDDDALVRVTACGLCGTDHEQFTGELAGGSAFVPGHETVGSVDAIGPRAAQRWGVAGGDRVAVEVFQSCRACPACRTGEYRRCARHGLADMYGFISVDREPGLWGGLCAAAAAKEAGVGFVMVTGLGARDADRLALASKFGADLAVDVSADDPVVELTKAAGALADVVVDVTARAPAAFAQAIALAARPGPSRWPAPEVSAVALPGSGPT